MIADCPPSVATAMNANTKAMKVIKNSSISPVIAAAADLQLKFAGQRSGCRPGAQT